MASTALIRSLPRRIGITAVIAFAGLAFAACGDDNPSNQRSNEIWCDGLCTSVRACGYQNPQCQSDCVSQRPGLSNLSTNGATAEQPCLEHLSCSAISGDEAAWSAELDACWDQAKLSVAVPPRVHQFCPDHALAWFNCGYRLSLDDCGHLYGMWRDAVIDALARCEAKPTCDDFAACEDAVFNSL